MWVQGRQTWRLELAAVSQPDADTRRTAVVGSGSGDLAHGGAGSRARSAGSASLPGAVAVAAYCPSQRPSRPGASSGGGHHAQGQAQRRPELFQSRLPPADASGLAAARAAVLLSAWGALAAPA